MMQKNGLAHECKWASLLDVIGNNGVFVDGDWIESKDQDPDGDVRLIQLADIGDGGFRNKSCRYLTTKRAKEINCTFLSEGDILIARMPDPIGRACIFPLKGTEKYVTAVDVAIVRPDPDIVDNKYLKYVINSPKFRHSIEELQSGTTRKRISRKNLSTLKFPLPSKANQQAIVSKIEELFSELDKAIENLRLAQQQLKTYRQSVLKWAFEGRLTEEWRRSQVEVLSGLEPLSIAAEEQEEYRSKLPKGWKWVKSGELFEFVTSGSRGWAKYYSNSGAIFLRITNLDFDSLNLDLEESKIQYVNPPSNSEGIRTKIKEGDFLFSITGYLGMFAIAPALDNAYVNQHISLCRPNFNFDNKYVGYWIISKTGGYHYLNKKTKGATKAGLGLDDIKNFPVPMCCPEEQQQIVLEIESRLNVADKMEESINQSLQQAEALRQSILKKAFEGGFN
jgi:type I restriction enzyme, S subunit